MCVNMCQHKKPLDSCNCMVVPVASTCDHSDKLHSDVASIHVATNLESEVAIYSHYLPPFEAISHNFSHINFSRTTIVVLEHQVYPYSTDLGKLQQQVCTRPLMLDRIGFSTITSPLKWDAWSAALAHHPDKDLTHYLLAGIRDGFRIGFNPSQQLVPAKRNMPSVDQHPQVVDEYIQQECVEGRVLGPIPLDEAQGMHVSRFGVIPKKHKINKWRLILDLSFPIDHSVNDGISPDLCSLRYESIDDAARIVSNLGCGCMMAKVDIARAYRNVPIHPGDRHLLGMLWKDHIYIDKALPFGLRSAPKIFCALSDTVEWVAQQRGVSACLHYIDDFMTFGPPGDTKCQENLYLLIKTCEQLGLPLAAEKVEGPATGMTFLGIYIDSVEMVLRLPPEKLSRLKNMIAQWLFRTRAATKRDVLSLIGELSHAAKVVIPGRSFLRQLIDVAKQRKQLHDWIRVNDSIRSDLLWWHLFMERWNGTSILRAHLLREPDTLITSDASGSWGCGAFMNTQWFQCAWSHAWLDVNIACKEFVPIVMGLQVWSHQLTGKHVRVQCDNAAVVAVINHKSCKDPLMAHLLRCTQFILAKHDIQLSAEHIQGKLNVAADALSRDNLDIFYLTIPQASPLIPQPLQEWIMLSKPDWLCPLWRGKLNSFYSKV